MDIKKFNKKDEEYFEIVDGKIVAVESVMDGDDEDIYENRKDYRFDLSCYDGPLDLLLYLVKRNKIEIKDIFVSDITQQYLDIIGPIENWSEEEIAYAGEFITTAAELIDIKAKLMLPIETIDVAPEDLPGNKLYHRLEEYSLFKRMSEKMQGLETINRFFRAPVFSEDDYRLAIKDFSMDKLLDAYAAMSHRIERKELAQEPKKIQKERFSISDRMNFISRKLLEDKKVSLFSLLESDFNKLEIVNTFLATLELMKRQVVNAVQSNLYEDIEISLKEGVEAPVTVSEEEIDEQFKGNS